MLAPSASNEDPIPGLLAEVAALRAEVAASRAEVARLRDIVEPPRARAGSNLVPAIGGAVEEHQWFTVANLLDWAPAAPALAAAITASAGPPRKGRAQSLGHRVKAVVGQEVDGLRIVAAGKVEGVNRFFVQVRREGMWGM